MRNTVSLDPSRPVWISRVKGEASLSIKADLGRLNMKAGEYAEDTLYRMAHQSMYAAQRRRRRRFILDLRVRKPFRYHTSRIFLKGYYLFSAPVASLVARNDLLLGLARTFIKPTLMLAREAFQ